MPSHPSLLLEWNVRLDPDSKMYILFWPILEMTATPSAAKFPPVICGHVAKGLEIKTHFLLFKACRLLTMKVYYTAVQ